MPLSSSKILRRRTKRNEELNYIENEISKGETGKPGLDKFIELNKQIWDNLNNKIEIHEIKQKISEIYNQLKLK